MRPDITIAHGKAYMLRFLPYLEMADGSAVETVIGYSRESRGYGYGRWEEFFHTLPEARARMEFLIKSGAIEDIALYPYGPGTGGVIDEWSAS